MRRHRHPRCLLAVGLAILVACSHHRPAMSGDPDNMQRDLARQLAQRGAWEEALSVLNEIRLRHPDDAEMTLLRGVAFREQGMLDEARTELLEAADQAPMWGAVHAALAIALDMAGQGAEAIVHHQRAVALEPKNAGWLNNLGYSLATSGRVRESVEIYQRALRIDPLDRRTRNNLGFAYARLGDFRQAALQFDRGGAVSESRVNLGYAYELAGRLPQALDAYEEGSRLEGASGPAHVHWQRLSAKLGRPASASANQSATPPAMAGEGGGAQ